MADQNPGNANPAGAQGNQGIDPKSIQISVPENQQTGTYANAVSVNVTANEVMLDFGYLIPSQNQQPVIKVVSRVNMNHRVAESFMQIFQNAMLDYRNKVKEQENKQNPSG